MHKKDRSQLRQQHKARPIRVDGASFVQQIPRGLQIVYNNHRLLEDFDVHDVACRLRLAAVCEGSRTTTTHRISCPTP